MAYSPVCQKILPIQEPFGKIIIGYSFEGKPITAMI